MTKLIEKLPGGRLACLVVACFLMLHVDRQANGGEALEEIDMPPPLRLSAVRDLEQIIAPHDLDLRILNTGKTELGHLRWNTDLVVWVETTLDQTTAREAVEAVLSADGRGGPATSPVVWRYATEREQANVTFNIGEKPRAGSDFYGYAIDSYRFSASLLDDLQSYVTLNLIPWEEDSGPIQIVRTDCGGYLVASQDEILNAEVYLALPDGDPTSLDASACLMPIYLDLMGLLDWRDHPETLWLIGPTVLVRRYYEALEQ